MEADRKRASWSGQLAFVLAAAASAIGLGNLWRFPYLAAQYGGGTFIVVYLALVVTLGFTLMLSEIAIGRKTQQSQLTAYSRLHRGWGFIGLLGTIVPALIVPYYCVIGGWVLKYFVTYCQMAFAGATPMGAEAANSSAFFSAFISANFAPFGYGSLFVLACAAVIVMGVKNGIERSNLVLMPALFLLAIAISIYVICLPETGDGLKYYLVPSMDALSVKGADGRMVFSFAQLGKTILGAMGQMFYSLSLAMGIMITYGSYMRKTDSIEKCVRRIEVFDTLIAVIAGLMIIPVVYMFAVKTGTPVKEAMNAGPGLMFITLPKVFATLGAAGPWVGLAFFALVIFAALTSAISLFEACVASVCDLLHLSRKAATFFMGAVILFLATFSALGYGAWADVRVF
ncbi:MAG: sodium-dependent transporter, partial [Kiritimatiellae bacterium]|nr:sodium-dependent transporter [Kiritimatiellia bacterium]